MLRSIKGIDLFRKVTQDFQQSTALGGILSLISFLTMLLLLTTELYSYHYSPLRPSLQVEPHSDEDYMLLSLNISLFSSPCSSLVVFYVDSTQHHFKFYSIHRQVLSSEGEVLSTEPYLEINDVSEQGCGSCYGAESEWRSCCNSCGEVMEAYANKNWKPPQFSDITQCQKFVSSDSVKGPGCRLTGSIQVKKIPGSLHIKNTFNLDRRSAQSYSARHFIESLAFVDPKSQIQAGRGPLDGSGVERGFVVNYYLKLMPAIRDKEKYYEPSTNHLVFERVTNPEVIFTYDLEPITTVYDSEKSLVKFTVNVCAIIGGWFAVTVFVSRLIIK